MMSRKRIAGIMSILAVTLSGSVSVFADETLITPQETIDTIEGSYAGTFLCSLGEMGMTLSLKDAGEFTQIDFAGHPCRSARGRCNDEKVIAHKGKRKTVGVINFFPTISNPNAPQGAFHVSGWVDYRTKYIKKMAFEPGEWIEKPDNFGASAMTGRLIGGTISGQPTAPGCHSLKMQKVLGLVDN